MNYRWTYRTPEGFSNLAMCGDGDALTGLWFEGSRDGSRNRSGGEMRETPAFRETCRWLDEYFAGRQPDFTPPFRLEGATAFRRAVAAEMLKIPFGKTVSYGAIAKTLAKRFGKARMSAQAVGGAVGWNPVCIVIPCHRVIGTDGALTGYGGGLGNKIALLKLEGVSL